VSHGEVVVHALTMGGDQRTSRSWQKIGKKCRNPDCSWQNMPLVLKFMQESTPQEICPWIRSQWLPPSSSSNRDLVFRAESDTLTPGY